MRERFKQWPLKTTLNQGWVMGAIATPVVVGMAWWLGILPARGLASDGDRRSHPDTATVALPHGDSFIRDMGPIATVIGGIFLLIKFRFAHSTVETVNLSGIDLGGVNLSGTDLSGADLGMVQKQRFLGNTGSPNQTIFDNGLAY
ncbi:MAG: pentapeptide repeat-containing protein [Cyanobacteria bacterium J06639_14]